MSGPAGEATFERRDRELVYSVARRIVGCSADADDVTQDALLRAFQHRDSFRGDSRYHTWLYRIAATTALGELRRRRRARVKLVEGKRQRWLLENRIDPAPPAFEQLAIDEDAEALGLAFRELAPAYREVVLARMDASERDVAARLGISVASVKVRAHRARQQLRASLGCAKRSAA